MRTKKLLSLNTKLALRNESGFSLMEVMFAVVILGIISLVMASTFRQMSKQQARSNFLANMSMLRSSFSVVLQSTTAWDATIKANTTTMTCLQTLQSCSAYNGATKATPFMLFTADGKVFYDDQPTSGFTAMGAPCKTFGSDPTCILHLTLSWYAGCNPDGKTDPLCKTPTVYVIGTFNYTGPTSYNPINWGNFNFTSVSPANSTMIIAQTCASMGGTYTYSTKLCNMSGSSTNNAAAATGQTSVTVGTSPTGTTAATPTQPGSAKAFNSSSQVHK